MIYHIFNITNGEYAGSGVSPSVDPQYGDTTVAPTHDDTESESPVYWDGSTWGDVPSAPHLAPAINYDVSALIAGLWDDFNSHALDQTDLNSRASISLILADPSSTAQQVERATDWGNWWSDHWLLYGQKKAEIKSTQAPVEYTFAPAPWTIWDLV